MENEEKEQLQAKNRRIAVGATVGGVLIVLFLLIVLIVQFVHMGVLNSKQKKLDESINAYKQQIERDEGILKEFNDGDLFYFYAVMQGWR